jgi:hypothetical protein
MFNKKRLMILTLALLLVAVTFLAGCIKGQEKAGQDIVDELIEEGAATMSPTATPTPTPTPAKVGFYFTDEQIEGIKDLWPVKNTGIDDLGSLYAIYADNSWTDGTSYLTFEYRSEEPPEQLQEDFGVPVFGHAMPELYYSGVWEGETNTAGDPLEVTVNIGQMPDFSSVYVSFQPDQKHLIVDELHAEYWPDGWHGNGVLPDEEIQYGGIGFFPGTQGVEIWRSYQVMPAGALPIFRDFEAEFADRDNFESIPEDGYIAPRIGFSYDIKGDGTTIADAWIDVYDSSDSIQVAFSARIEY